MKIAEYTSLRREIMERIRTRIQITLGTILIFGGTTQLNLSADVAFWYPLLILFIVIIWIQNDFRIKMLGQYIEKKYERGTETPEWETHVAENRGFLGTFGQSLSFGGISIGSQVAIVYLAHQNLSADGDATDVQVSTYTILIFITLILFFVEFLSLKDLTGPEKIGE